MEIVELWPLSQGEIDNRPESFVDAVFETVLPAVVVARVARGELFDRALCGGFPESLQRPVDRRSDWFEIVAVRRDPVLRDRHPAVIEQLIAGPLRQPHFGVKAGSQGVRKAAKIVTVPLPEHMLEVSSGREGRAEERPCWCIAPASLAKTSTGVGSSPARSDWPPASSRASS